MAYFFTLLLLIAFIGMIVFLIKPSLTSIRSRAALSRKHILLYGLTLSFILFALVGVFAPEVDNKEAQAIQNEVLPVVAEKEIQPVKAEANLGMTPEQFRQKFNAKLKDLNIDSMRPVAEFDLKTGEIRDTFQVIFSQDVGLTGVVNKDGSLRELLFIVKVTNDYRQATMDMLILTGITTQVISPGTEAGNQVVQLMTKALENIGQEENTHKKVFGDVEYYALANEVTGLWVGVSPAEE